jgi:hypothetical protein
MGGYTYLLFTASPYSTWIKPMPVFPLGSWHVMLCQLRIIKDRSLRSDSIRVIPGSSLEQKSALFNWISKWSQLLGAASVSFRNGRRLLLVSGLRYLAQLLSPYLLPVDESRWTSLENLMECAWKEGRTIRILYSNGEQNMGSENVHHWSLHAVHSLFRGPRIMASILAKKTNIVSG